ncbi:MAG: hypothetical protein HWD59_07915 [Coxiellaceae bacterium]|nr:MAG: hypothetical protein HWD59_07915 [Coxiellaceae bacterium]
MHHWLKLCWLILFSTAALADTNQLCKPTPFLNPGFDFKAFAQCQKFINKCPHMGAIVNETCVNKQVKKQSVCSQAQQLAKTLNVSVSQLTATQVNQLTQFTVVFPADGQQQFYLLTPEHCVIDTVIDPRKLDSNLAKQYKDKSFMMTTWGKPQYHTNADGSQSVDILLKITDQCVACPTLGWATLEFTTAKDGSFLQARLKNFSEQQPQAAQ